MSKTTTIIRRIRAASKRIAGPGNHTKGSYAKNNKGSPVGVFDPNAVSWCMVGALEREGVTDIVELNLAFNKIYNNYMSLSVFNDSSITSQWDAVVALNRLAEYFGGLDAKV